MASGAHEIRYLEDSGEEVVDYVAVGEAVRRKARITERPMTRREARERRNLYWLGLHLAGCTLEWIAADSGFSVPGVQYGIESAKRDIRREIREADRHAG
jgi:hypothetical protein